MPENRHTKDRPERTMKRNLVRSNGTQAAGQFSDDLKTMRRQFPQLISCVLEISSCKSSHVLAASSSCKRELRSGISEALPTNLGVCFHHARTVRGASRVGP